MNTSQAQTVLSILKQADVVKGGDYRAYERLKRQLQIAALRPDEYESAIRRLAKALGV
jgi:pantothenate kinase